MDALGYVEYITNSIKSKDLFQIVEITYEQCWEYLVWLDPVSPHCRKGGGGAFELFFWQHVAAINFDFILAYVSLYLYALRGPKLVSIILFYKLYIRYCD